MPGSGMCTSGTFSTKAPERMRIGWPFAVSGAGKGYGHPGGGGTGAGPAAGGARRGGGIADLEGEGGAHAGVEEEQGVVPCNRRHGPAAEPRAEDRRRRRPEIEKVGDRDAVDTARG